MDEVLKKLASGSESSIEASLSQFNSKVHACHIPVQQNLDETVQYNVLHDNNIVLHFLKEILIAMCYSSGSP